MYDLIIIGAGPAGMSASLYAARQKLNFLLISKNIGGLANYVPSLKNFLGIHYITGYDLVKKFQDHIKDFKVPIKTDIEVKKITQIKGGFKIKADGQEFETKSVIIASGRRFKRLGVKGENEYEGKGVSLCTACDGPLFKGKTIAIVGGGRTGLYSTLFMLSVAKKIYILEKNEIKEEGAIKEVARIVKSSKNVEIITGADTKEILGNNFANKIKYIKGKKEYGLDVEGVFIAIGYEPNTEFVRDLVELNNRGEIIIDKNNMADIPGLFSAGDCTDLHEKQVVVSVGEGAKATLSAIMYLERL